MSRRLAHRPRHYLSRINPQPLRYSRQEYLRQRWTYRQQRATYVKHPLGYGLSLVPWGWRLTREVIRRQA
jgi:hypothetical protein